MSKLWIIGDSFAENTPPPNINLQTWVNIISEKYKGESVGISCRASRDFQTILDMFLKNLKNISIDDFVILIIPSLNRVRLPLEKPRKDIVSDYFIGDKSYNENSLDENGKLEYPLSELKGNEFKNDLSVGIWSITNASNSSKNNYLDIIQSLKEYLPFNIFVWSWSDEINSELVLNKSDIIKELGFWKTLNDVWIETNGNDGIGGDLHWSNETHTAFANYLIVKFPQFFNS